MRLLLDTCAFLWMTDRVDHLTPLARRMLADPDNELILHQTSTLEIQIKYGLGKLPLGIPPKDFIPQALKHHDLSYHTLSDEDVFFQDRLPQIHRDPFDRLLISHAIVEGLTIVTPDPLIHQYPVKFLW